MQAQLRVHKDRAARLQRDLVRRGVGTLCAHEHGLSLAPSALQDEARIGLQRAREDKDAAERDRTSQQLACEEMREQWQAERTRRWVQCAA